MANLNHVEGIDKQPFPTPEQIEALTRELIEFCFQWGMWNSVAIYSNGKQYTADLGATDTQSPAVKVVPVGARGLLDRSSGTVWCPRAHSVHKSGRPPNRSAQ